MEPGGAGAQGPPQGEGGTHAGSDGPRVPWSSPHPPQRPEGAPLTAVNQVPSEPVGSKAPHSPGQRLCPHPSSRASERCIVHPTDTGAWAGAERPLLRQVLRGDLNAETPQDPHTSSGCSPRPGPRRQAAQWRAAPSRGVTAQKTARVCGVPLIATALTFSEPVCPVGSSKASPSPTCRPFRPRWESPL